MRATRTLSVRLASLGGAVALAAAGLAGSVALTLATSGGVAGADTPPFTSTCQLITGPTTLPVTVTGSITPNPVSPGGTVSLSGFGVQSSLSVATQLLIENDVFSGTLTLEIDATGATPASQTATFTIPQTTVPALPTVPLVLNSAGTVGSFTADATGATSVALTTGLTGSLVVTLNGQSLPPANCTQTSPEQIASAPIATPAGSVDAVLPNAGPVAGGTAVVIHGTYLSGPTNVTFGGVPATSFHGLTPDSIAAVAPPGSAEGAVDVQVTTAAGPSPTGPADLFHYTNGPIVNKVSPNTGPPAGGTSVTITGSGFTGATAVGFGSTAATGYTVNSSTSVTATAPAGSGVVDVTVTAPSTVLGPANRHIAAGPSETSIISQQDQYNYRTGYWLAAGDGGVFTYGNQGFYGSAGGLTLNQPVVGMASTPDGGGYWLVASDGGVFAYGDAAFYGSAGSLTLNSPIVGIAATPDGYGYWLVAADGGVFSYGDAFFYGSAGGLTLNQPVVGMASTPDGGGYWLVAADGGIFSYGDAAFQGSLSGTPLVMPATGIASTPDGGGYWIATADGGVFNLGDAGFYGSPSGTVLNQPVVGLASSPDGAGYWLAAGDGGVFAYPDATFFGSAGGLSLNSPIVGIAAVS